MNNIWQSPKSGVVTLRVEIKEELHYEHQEEYYFCA